MEKETKLRDELKVCAREWTFSKLIALGLFLFSFSIYLLTAGGHDYTGDGAQSFYTAENLVLSGTIAIDDMGPKIGAVKGNGHFYSKYAPGLAVAELPFFVGLHSFASVLGLENKEKSVMLRAWVPSLTNATITAATIAIVYIIVLQMGYNNTIGLIISFLVGFSTPLWPYAKNDLSEPLQSLLLLVAFWAIHRVKLPVSISQLLLAGLTLALLMLTKSIYIVLVPFLLIALLWRLRAAKTRAILIVSISFGLPILIGGLLHLAWNYIRLGSLFEFGYAEGFDTPILVGLYGWFLSSGKSVFLYAPILILLFGAMPYFIKRHPFETFVLAAMTAPLVILYAQFWSWHGDWAWGPRYAVPLISLWVFPIATVLSLTRKLWRTAVVTFGALGIFVQVLGITIDTTNYLNIHTYQITPVIHPGQGADMNQSQLDVHFIPEFSPLAGHWWLLKATIEQMKSPGKTPAQNVALQAFPWLGRSERIDWRPAHPEHAMVLDFWITRKPSYMNNVGTVALTLILSVLGILGLLLIIVSAVSAHWTERVWIEKTRVSGSS